MGHGKWTNQRFEAGAGEAGCFIKQCPTLQSNVVVPLICTKVSVPFDPRLPLPGTDRKEISNELVTHRKPLHTVTAATPTLLARPPAQGLTLS